MKNSQHHNNHLVNKSVRQNSRLPTPVRASHDDLVKRLQLYKKTSGVLAIQPKNQMRENFRSYIHYITNHPSSTAEKHSRRASPGSVTPGQPHSHIHTSEKQMNDHLQSKLQENNIKLSKKLMNSSKVRWKKID